jgi:hypothetical protein
VIRSAFLDAGSTAAGLLRDPAVAARWSAASALPGFTVGGLARHLANQVTHTGVLLAGPPGGTAIGLLDHFAGNGWVGTGRDSADNVAIRTRGEEAAVLTSAAELAAEVEDALDELRATVPAQRAERVVDLGEWALRIDDFLVTRVLELVVHVDDLAVSLDLPTPPLPPDAVEATVELLGRLAVRRHGPLPVVRTLARQERAPASIAAL